MFNEQQKLYPNRSYMPWEFIFLFFVIYYTCMYIPSYITNKLPIQREIIYKINRADKHFKQEEYFDALVIYMNLVDEDQNFKHGIKQIVLCAFSLLSIHDNDNFFILGMHYLNKLKKIDKYTHKDIEIHLPKKYHEEFNQLLEWR